MLLLNDSPFLSVSVLHFKFQLIYIGIFNGGAGEIIVGWTEITINSVKHHKLNPFLLKDSVSAVYLML